jgi:succinyl-diaminopimelate desuccinylase
MLGQNCISPCSRRLGALSLCQSMQRPLPARSPAAEIVDGRLVVDLARQLIRIPTENPPGDEMALVELVSQCLEESGCEVRHHDSPAGRPNVIARLGSGSRRLIWCGHMDVVPAGDRSQWTMDPFGGTLADGRVWGRGACDMKGGIAAMLGAVRALAKSQTELEGVLEIHLVSDEETMSAHGAAHLAGLGLTRADGCIVGEPTNLRLGIAERGALWLRVRCSGAAAHGSMPELGESAIRGISEFVRRLAAPDREHPLVGHATVNVGTIAGGTKINTVPDACVIEVDRRTLPGEDMSEVLAYVTKLTDEIRAERPRLTFKVSVISYAPPFETDPACDIAQVLTASANAITGRPVDQFGLTGFTDGRLYHTSRTPTVVYGPGAIELAHTSKECVAVDELVTASRVYANIVARFLAV